MNIIDRAADRLRGHWIQGQAEDGLGNVCMAQALMIAGASREAVEVVRTETGKPIAEFNDDPGTTEEDVLLLLKRASVLYDERYPS